MIRIIREFLAGEEAQDLIEYALLSVFVALAMLAAFVAIQNAIAAGYVSWDTADQNLWEPPDPG